MNRTPNVLSLLLGALRVYQWPKNLLVFAALVFAQQLDVPIQIVRSVAAFAILCAASSAVYLLNDMVDIEKDRAHPEKRHRPLASGAVRVSTAMAVMAFLAMGSLVAAFFIRPPFCAVVGLYMGLNVLYSLVLKNVIIVDVLAVALGFVLRAIGGAIALDVVFSNWLIVCTLFLALFLSLGKRRHELQVMDGTNDTLMVKAAALL